MRACVSLFSWRLQSKSHQKLQAEGDEDEDVEDDDLSLAQAISLYQHMREREEITTSHQYSAAAGPSSAGLIGSESGSAEQMLQSQRSTLKQDSYFSDEDASDND